MGSNAYLRFLARVAGRQPRLRPPPDGNLTIISPSQLADLMPYTHPISGYRSRSFERRCLELRVAELPPGSPQGSPRPPSPAPPPGDPQDGIHPAPTSAAGRQGHVSGCAGGGGILGSIGGGGGRPETVGAEGGGRRSSQSPVGSPGRAASASQAGAAELDVLAPTGAPTIRHEATTGGGRSDGDLRSPAPHHRDCHDQHEHQHQHRPEHRPESHRPDLLGTAGSTPVSTARSPAAVPGGAVQQGQEATAPPVHPASCRGSPGPDSGAPQPHPHLRSHPLPPHSYMEVRYPFTSLPSLWREYYRPGFPGLDPALVLEDFDTFAADVAARHVGSVPDSMLVTAILERMTWHVHLRTTGAYDSSQAPGVARTLAAAAAEAAATVGVGIGGGGGGGGGKAAAVTEAPNASSVAGTIGSVPPLAELAPTDMKLAGQVTWVGRSSMEVLLQLTAEAPLPRTSTPPTQTPPAAAAAAAASADGVDATSTVAVAEPEPAMHPTAETAAASSIGCAADDSGGRRTVTLAPGQLVATAEFVMALRDSSLRRAVDVPSLHPRDALERELFRRGRDLHRQRQARRERDTAVHVTAHSAGAGGAGAAATAPSKPSSPTAVSAASRPPSSPSRAVVEAGGNGGEGSSGGAAAAVPTAATSQPARATGAGAAAEDDDAELLLAQALYDNVLRSDLCRTVPLDAEALRLLTLEPLAWDEAPLGRTRKRRRGDTPGDDALAPSVLVYGPALDYTARQRDATPAATHAPAAPDGTSGYDNRTVIVVPVRQTELHRTVIAEFQDRNTSGTVFGGHLLRLAYEHAAAAAAAFAGAPCELLWLEEGAISAPARMGDVLHAVSRVVWAEPAGRALRVIVRVGRYDVSAPSQHVLGLTLSAAFLAPAGAEKEAGREVKLAPTTLTEAGEVLAAQRRHAAVMAALAAEDTTDSRS